MQADAVIIGAGIHGCSVALQLARAGLKPVVFEQAYPGRHASGVNAGGVRRLGRHVAEIPLAVASMDLWHNIQELVDNDCGFHKTGQIKVAESEAEFETLKQRVQALNALGFFHEELINQAELKERIPAISNHCYGAILCKDDGYAKPYQTVNAFQNAAIKAGAIFKYNQPVAKVKRDNNTWKVASASTEVEAPILVNCAGAWADKIAASLEEVVPLEAQAPMLMISERLPRFCTPVVGATSRPLSFKQFENGTVLIGGGHRGLVDMTQQTASLDMAGICANARTAGDIFPNMKSARIVRCWAGIEAVMPDQIPVISPSSTYPDAYHVFGFSAHGFQLGPITGRIISDLVLHGKTDLPIENLSIKRFLH